MARQFLTPIALPGNPSAPLQAATKSYVDSVTASLTGGGQPILTPTTKTAAYTAQPRDLVLADASGTAFTVTLPPASGGGMLEVKKVDASTNIVTVATQGSDTVGSLGAATVPIRLVDQAMVFQANGSNWVIVDGYQSLSALDGRYLYLPSTTQAASYTLALTDAGTAVESTSATAATVTVPANSTTPFPIGSVVELAQYGAGQITVAPASGVTLRTSGSLTTRAQYSVLSLRKRSSDEWLVSGDST